jgi:GNAT superfamily N-acetyltransferase
VSGGVLFLLLRHWPGSLTSYPKRVSARCEPGRSRFGFAAAVGQDAGVRVEQVNGVEDPELVEGLAEVLADCVAGGASVNFVQPFGIDDARDWWRANIGAAQALTWVARENGGRVVGVVRLMLATQPNAPHRAEVVKLLVHRDARGQGCASQLLDAVEDGARRMGRSTLVLDTETGCPAEGMYARRGWQRIGVIDNFALAADGRMSSTTIMAKYL